MRQARQKNEIPKGVGAGKGAAAADISTFLSQNFLFSHNLDHEQPY